jgi:hypothetical protein
LKPNVPFKDYGSFWRWCREECPDRSIGCANKCALRKLLGIPPFGRSYKGKLSGPIDC